MSATDAWGAKPIEHHVRLRATVDEPTEVVVEFGVAGEANSIGFLRGLVAAVTDVVAQVLRSSGSEAEAQVLVGASLFQPTLVVRLVEPEPGLAGAIERMVDGWLVHFHEPPA